MAFPSQNSKIDFFEDFSGCTTFGFLSSFSDLIDCLYCARPQGKYLLALRSGMIGPRGIQDNGDAVIFSPRHP